MPAVCRTEKASSQEEKLIGYIGLGSNLGESEAYLDIALASLDAHSDIRLLSTSPYYGSKPHGPQDQPDYINAVTKIETSLEPLPLLDNMQKIENDNNRVRGEQRWTARTLDLDLLLYDGQTIDSERLIVPHPHMLERPFVLYPLYDIEPTLIFPDGKKLSDFITDLPEDLWLIRDTTS